jgi:hypothetical protein
MLRTVSQPAGEVRKLLQNLPATGPIMGLFVAPWLLPRQRCAHMKLAVLILALSVMGGAFAQGPSPAPAPGPSSPPVPGPSVPRRDLWQVLTPEQRQQLWLSLTPEQRSDVWRGLQSHERREMRERLSPQELRGSNGPWARRPPDADNRPHGGSMMTPEERQQMREQIREAHRLRRERMEAERARRTP